MVKSIHREEIPYDPNRFCFVISKNMGWNWILTISATVIGAAVNGLPADNILNGKHIVQGPAKRWAPGYVNAAA